MCFENGGKSQERRNADGLQKLEKQGNKFSSSTSRKNAAVNNLILAHNTHFRFLTSVAIKYVLF